VKRPGVPTRKTRLRQKKRPRRRNPQRAAKNLARAYGPEERRAWVKSLPSVVSGEGPCVNVHVKAGGTSYKADAEWIVPLTAAEHDELHKGQQSFETKYRIDLRAAALNIEARWQTLVANKEPLPW
jgi:hypothetical protein